MFTEESIKFCSGMFSDKIAEVSLIVVKYAVCWTVYVSLIVHRMLTIQ